MNQQKFLLWDNPISSVSKHSVTHHFVPCFHLKIPALWLLWRRSFFLDTVPHFLVSKHLSDHPTLFLFLFENAPRWAAWSSHFPRGGGSLWKTFLVGHSHPCYWQHHFYRGLVPRQRFSETNEYQKRSTCVASRKKRFFPCIFPEVLKKIVSFSEMLWGSHFSYFLGVIFLFGRKYIKYGLIKFSSFFFITLMNNREYV